MAKDKKNKFDLSNLDVVAGANVGHEVELLAPGTGENTGIKIKVLGKDGDIFKSFINNQNRKRMAKAQKSRKLEVDPDQIATDVIMLLAACTVSWENLDLDGKPLEFSKVNAEMVYERFPWIREQVDVAVNDRGNFMKG